MMMGTPTSSTAGMSHSGPHVTDLGSSIWTTAMTTTAMLTGTQVGGPW